MKLNALIEPFTFYCNDTLSQESVVTGLTMDSRAIEEGYVFIAVSGAKVDGHDYIDSAIKRGAVAVIGERSDIKDINAPYFYHPDLKTYIAKIAAHFYAPMPEIVVAVTGTNGKTSTACFTQQLWESLSYKAASIGTLGVRGQGVEQDGSLTTPDPVSLHHLLNDLQTKHKVTHVALEASSHGLVQHRLDGLTLNAAAFTNLTRDHLDYHKDEESYFQAKALLFSERLPEKSVAVLNADSDRFHALESICTARGQRIIDYGEQAAFLKIQSYDLKPQGVHLTLRAFDKDHLISLPLVGKFQIYNALAALGLCLAQSPDDQNRFERLLHGLENLKGAPGRLQAIAGHPKGAAVYVDYAHTPDALDNILHALRHHTAGKLVALVGCGGDRDAGKRPIMGRIAADLADIAIITDDNPRTENADSIRAQMLADMPVHAKENVDFFNIAGRRNAIEQAVSLLQSGDVLVVAGKGHEQGQIIGSIVEPFSDVEEVEKAIIKFRQKLGL
jgi:UDP-N-acetylmuramoyl-L-alanyl-D-glutamate--2,6-diaminopimelate ligase